MSFVITTLIENNTSLGSPELHKEHGLSIFIEADGKRILFDTGQTGDFLKNAEKLNIDINALDHVILSHGHYDHTGGVKALIEKRNKPFSMIVGKGFFNEKYKSVSETELKFVGNAFDETLIIANDIDLKYISEDVVNLSENIMIFSNFIRKSEFEELNQKFFIKSNEELELDHFTDEVVLAIKTVKGLFVILGCSHVGAVNILETISQRTKMNIYGIVGGTHLVDADEIRLQKTIEYLEKKNIQQIGVSHCTGEQGAKRLENALKEKFFNNNGGNSIKLT